ncbi:hypothetical protein [Acidaminobacter hydrogenoformans]|uniref:Immunity protein 17 n=1 Tax=Acidaminobacter hydrogenoformans DSM 2784 TaxID=1120920 RepID=A0A1G5S3D5_9FIRM|nr:hypothetical protein [Acidaminobacter hydrogenoformans]SCZ80922.1 hypothetical protein SAMN03080599_02517 [Acidaminobacter hydrogenoformans DSM 2784]
MKLWGALAVIYAAVVVVIAITKPEKIWSMKKIKFFIKIMGEKGTEVFFYVWAVIFLVLGIWLFTR